MYSVHVCEIIIRLTNFINNQDVHLFRFKQLETEIFHPCIYAYICTCDTVTEVLSHWYASSDSHHHQTHSELPNVQNAANTSHDGHHPEADGGDPLDRHEEGDGDDVPLAVLGAVWDGPGVGHEVGERQHK